MEISHMYVNHVLAYSSNSIAYMKIFFDTLGINVTEDNNVFSYTEADFTSLQGKKGLKILHLNVNGLLNKLKILAQEIKFDILCLNETKLDARIDDNDICITGYTSYRRDGNRLGSGVVFYVSDSLESYPTDESYNKDIEALWTKICLGRSKPLVIGAIYCPPGKGKS